MRPDPSAPLRPPTAGRLNAAVVRPQLVVFPSVSSSSSSSSPATPSSCYSFHPFAARGPFYASPPPAADAVARRCQVTSVGVQTCTLFPSSFFFPLLRACVCVCLFFEEKDKVLFQFFCSPALGSLNAPVTFNSIAAPPL